MDGLNSLKKGWWENVTLIIWGATAKLSAENVEVQKKIKELLSAGVKISACKACADQLGVTEILKSLGIEVIYWGQPLTDLIKSGEKATDSLNDRCSTIERKQHDQRYLSRFA